MVRITREYSEALSRRFRLPDDVVTVAVPITALPETVIWKEAFLSLTEVTVMVAVPAETPCSRDGSLLSTRTTAVLSDVVV